MMYVVTQSHTEKSQRTTEVSVKLCDFSVYLCVMNGDKK